MECRVGDLERARDHPSGAHLPLPASDDFAMATGTGYDPFGWEPGFEPRQPDLLRQSRLVFVHDLTDNNRLTHTILGELGAQVGTVAEEGTGAKRLWKLEWRPGNAPTRVAVYDEAGDKVVEFLRAQAKARRFETPTESGRCSGRS